MTGSARVSKTAGISILPADLMHLVPKVAQATSMEEPNFPRVTPRGMAAPPPARPKARFEGDPSRPATIRIEATPRLLAERRRDLERHLDRVQVAAPANTRRFAAQPGCLAQATRLMRVQSRRLRWFLRKLMATLNRPNLRRSSAG
jgi:hypothetical protein